MEGHPVAVPFENILYFDEVTVQRQARGVELALTANPTGGKPAINMVDVGAKRVIRIKGLVLPENANGPYGIIVEDEMDDLIAQYKRATAAPRTSLA